MGGSLVFVRCCGQDCPRAGIGPNNGARVVNPQQRPKRQAGCERRKACARDRREWAVPSYSCVAADKTVRAPGLAPITERGSSTRSNARNDKRGAKGARRARVIVGNGRFLRIRALLRTRLSARRDWPQ